MISVHPTVLVGDALVHLAVPSGLLGDARVPVAYSVDFVAVPSVLHVAEFPYHALLLCLRCLVEFVGYLHPVPDVPVLARVHVPAAKSLGCVSVPSAY